MSNFSQFQTLPKGYKFSNAKRPFVFGWWLPSVQSATDVPSWLWPSPISAASGRNGASDRTLSLLHLQTLQRTKQNLHCICIAKQLGMHGYPVKYLLSKQIVAFFTVCIWIWSETLFTICICIQLKTFLLSVSGQKNANRYRYLKK